MDDLTNEERAGVWADRLELVARMMRQNPDQEWPWTGLSGLWYWMNYVGSEDREGAERQALLVKKALEEGG